MDTGTTLFRKGSVSKYVVKFIVMVTVIYVVKAKMLD